MRGDPRRKRFLRLRPRTMAEIERAVDDEIHAHLEMRAEALIRAGETPGRARAEALLRFGDVAEARRGLIGSIKERNVRRRRAEWLDGMRRDLAYAFRCARRSPGYSLFAIATLAVGIGATTATFTLVNGVLLRALPFPDADRLVQLQSVDSAGNAVFVVSSGNWLDWKEQNRTLASTALHQSARMSVMVGQEAVRASVQQVSGGFFEVIGAPMRVGRAFDEAETQSGAAVAVIGEGLWQSLFGGDPTGGGALTVNGRVYAIAGVVSAGHEYPSGTDVWLPIPYRRETGELRNWVNWLGIARLRPGVSVEQADADLDKIAAGIRATDPAGIYSYGVDVRPLKAFLVGDASTVLWLLMGAVAFVLLIACTNLASVNVARGSVRARDFAVRVALGAGRRRDSRADPFPRRTHAGGPRDSPGATLDNSLSRRQFMMGVFTTFSILALLLAAMGVYSLLSFAVAQRTREIAIRSALGARRITLVAMVLRNAMRVVTLGVVIGLLAAFALTRVLSSLLFETSPLDPLTFLAVTSFLMVTAFVAALAPAVRAARLDPLEALHGE